MPSHASLLTSVGRKGREELLAMAQEHPVRLIIDASHPYAVEISENAMSIARELDLPYIRFERESVDSYPCTSFREYADAAAYLAEREGNILLTIGTNNMRYFTGLRKERLYARIAPFQGSLEACETLGFEPGQIIAMSFRFSREFNATLYRELSIRYLVTKESGDDGGIREKLDAAMDTGVEIVLIERPTLTYPELCYDRESLYGRIREVLHG